MTDIKLLEVGASVVGAHTENVKKAWIAWAKLNRGVPKSMEIDEAWTRYGPVSCFGWEEGCETHCDKECLSLQESLEVLQFVSKQAHYDTSAIEGWNPRDGYKCGPWTETTCSAPRVRPNILSVSEVNCMGITR